MVRLSGIYLSLGIRLVLRQQTSEWIEKDEADLFLKHLFFYVRIIFKK